MLKKGKKEALLEQSCYNRRAGRVRDILFDNDEFFDARDLVQVKYEMLRRVHADKQSVSFASGSFGFSRVSFYKVKESFDAEGLAGLAPKKRGPHGRHKLTDEVIKFAETALAQQESMPAVVRQVEEKFKMQIHQRSIERAMNGRKKKR